MKLQLKFTLLIFLIALLSIVCISFFTFIFTRNALQEASTSQQLELTQQTLDKIDRLLYERYNGIQSIAANEIITQAVQSRNKIDPAFSDELQRTINKLLVTTGPWDDIDIVDANGIIVYSIDPTAIGKPITQEQQSSYFYNSTIKSLTPLYSDALVDESTHKPTMIFAAPIFDPLRANPSPIGVAMAHLSWPIVSEILQNTKYPYVDLYNKDGLEIGDGNPDSVSQALVTDPSNRLTITAALQESEGSTIFEDKKNNINALATYTREKGILNYKGNDWILVIKTPTNQAFSSAVSIAVKSSLSLIPLIIFTNGLLLFFILQLLKPIETLTQTTKQLATGDFTRRVSIHSKDEIGELANAFNDMAVKLQESHGTLEQKVEEKTKALSENVTNLESTKKAMVNVMEDLQKDKSKIDEQKKILDSILENLPLGVILSQAPSGKALIVNKSAINLIGKEIDPNVSQESVSQVYQIFKPDGTPYPFTETPLAIALQQGKLITKDDLVIHRTDGSKLFIRATSVPIRNQMDSIISVVSVFEDITKEREVDRMKTEFISLASHQLRTPLSAIKWFSEMLLGGDAGDLNTEQHDFAKNISDSTERMIQLVNSLLNISRIESGRIMIDPQPTDLKEMVEGIVKELEVKTKQKQQTLIVSVHEELPKINIDPRLIRQVYLNLLTNAIKYSPKGSEISVFISKKDDEIISQVTDNGYGIPKSQQNKVFQKFFRAENISKIETDGTGLGLYLIKAIVASSQGRIWYQSEEGKGTTFWFSLPLAGTPAKKGEVTLDS